ncbi:MAG: T9SS type A sorting domain-containing protein [Bacteroidetes bacterium]|nr:T9SS type A sorting domain-containing protein [Bacteroidota bacterium]
MKLKNILSKSLLLFFVCGLLSNLFAQPAAPTTGIPAIGATGLDTSSVTFTWTHTSTAINWQIMISTSPTMTPVIYENTLGQLFTDTTYTMPDTLLSPGTKYYWSVRAFDISANASAWSDTADFTTNYAPIASAINITGSPYLGAALTGNYTYSDADGDAQGTSTYQWFRSDNNLGLNKTAIPSATSLTYTLVTADSGKYITFKVTPIAQTGTSPGATVESAYLGPVIDPPPPSTPTLIYPKDSTYRVKDLPTFIWSTSASASSYEILITPDPTFSSILIDSTGITDTTFTVTTPLSHGSPYYWSVRAKNVSGTSSYAPKAMFVVSINGVNGPQVPIPTWPINGQDIYSDTSDIRWHLSYADSSLVFDVLVALDSTFATPIIDSVGATGDSFIGTGFLSDSTYYWKIRSRDIIHPDTSAYSPIAYFHVSKSHTHPILAWPVGGGNVYQPTQTFSWYLNGPAPGITYDFKLSLNPDLSNPDTSAAGLTSRFITFTSLRSGKTYYWQIVSHVTGYVDSSAIDSFNVVQSAGPVVPVLSWPIGGSYVYSNVPTLNWFVNSTGTGLSYDIRYALDTASLAGATVYSTTNLYYTVATPLLSDTTYYWQVRSRNGTDTSSFSTPDSFKVFAGSGNPVVPVLSNPIHGNNVYTNNPTLSWYLNIASTGLTYQVRYSLYIDSLNNAPIYNTGTDSTFYTVVSPLPYDSVYYWQVRSKSATDSSAFCQPDSFTVVSGNGNPAVPIPSWPIGGATVFPNPPILNWYLNVPLSNLNYMVQYSVNSDMSTATTVAGIDTNNYQIPSALTDGTTYYWRVRTYSTLISGDTSAWSPTQNFVTASLNGPVVPRIGSPQNGVLLKINNPMLSWYLPTAGKNLTYELQYSSKADFENATTINNLSKTLTVINNLQKGQTYYWKVRSTSNNGISSAYSSSGIFVIEGITGIKNGSTPYTFEVQQNYPNPFNPSTQINFTIPKASIVSIKIYNMLGQLVKTLIDEQKNAGFHTIVWNGDNNFGQHVASGAYIYRVIAGENVAVKKMILLK